MLFTLVAFIGLFVAAATAGVIFYIKSEEYRNQAAALQTQRDELATAVELRKIGALVGTKQARKSTLATMLDYLDQTVAMIIGGLPADASAEVKVDTANKQFNDTRQLLTKEYLDVNELDPNTTGLVRMAELLKSRLDIVSSDRLSVQQQLDDLQKRFDNAVQTASEKEQMLLAEKKQFQQQVMDMRTSYDQLKTLMEQTADQQVQTCMEQLEEERSGRKETYQQLLKTEAEFKIAEDRMKRALEKLQALVPAPDTEVAAYKADGKIILINAPEEIVHINLGSDDRIYRGLTFSVYDQHVPIPKDGKPKAEIQVYDVSTKTSVARIVRSEIKRPILTDDPIANLIWDSEKTNVFAVAGDFDLNGDGEIDYEGADKIKALVQKWGARVADSVTIDTDFVVLGSSPQVPPKPTREQIDVDPMANEKYEASLQVLEKFKNVQAQATSLSIPVFNTERFLYLIGYKTLSARADAF
jgi:hypothetical protein